MCLKVRAAAMLREARQLIRPGPTKQHRQICAKRSRPKNTNVHAQKKVKRPSQSGSFTLPQVEASLALELDVKLVGNGRATSESTDGDGVGPTALRLHIDRVHVRILQSDVPQALRAYHKPRDGRSLSEGQLSRRASSSLSLSSVFLHIALSLERIM